MVRTGTVNTPRGPTTVGRRNTRLESEGAEFLVLGHLLMNAIAAYKTYTNMPGYDVVAVNPKRHTSARISVKSRWHRRATGFIIKNFDTDFVVVVKLNRGSVRTAENPPPEFFVLPTKIVRAAASKASSWGRIEFGKIAGFRSYCERWDLIQDFLRIK